MTVGDSTVLFRAVPRKFKLPPAEKRTLTTFAQTLSERVGPDRPWACLISSDRELRRLNASFLGNDYSTDVLSFPAPPDAGYLGEIAISTERAYQQAAQFNHPVLSELQILMLHGFLHLTGMDHESDRGQMARAEKKWRGAFDLPTTLIARSKETR
jgi:probable rRNA maturation factor